MRKPRICIPGFVLLAVLGCAGQRPEDPFAAIVDEATRRYFRINPEVATIYGVPAAVAGGEYAARLNERSPAAEWDKRDEYRKIIDLLESIEPAELSDDAARLQSILVTQFRSGLGPGNVVDYGAVFNDYGSWYVPYVVTQLSGPHIAIPQILEKQHTVGNERDAEAYIRRLEEYGATIDRGIEKIRHDRDLGVVPPDFIIDKTLEVIADRSAGPPSEHSLVVSFRQKLEDAGIGEVDALVGRAEHEVANTLVPANVRLAQALEELRADSDSDAGIWRLPKGEPLYRALITHMTDTTLEPEVIHRTGLDEVQRITSEMDATLRRESYAEGSVGERMTRLGREERFLYPNTDEGKARLIEDLNARMAEIESLLPRWFGTLPPQKVVVQRIPAHAERSSTGGFYDPPALDGSRPGTYWINLSDTAAWPSFTLKTLTYHEANPGHHLQTALGMGHDTPILLTVLYSNAFGEGWALYAEALAKEMGLYDADPYGDLGRLRDELHRAVRLVVDTGMHALRWSRQQAIDYVVDHEGVLPEEAEGEIDRYVVWPAQALGYKVGMLKLQELRADAERALGDRFDIRAFHDEILRAGGGPLQVLETRVERWIAGRREGT